MDALGPVERVERGGVRGQGLGGPARPAGAAAGPLGAARHPRRPGRWPGPAPAHRDDDEAGRHDDDGDRHRRDRGQGRADVAQRGRAGAGRAGRHGRRRVEVLPPVAGEPHLDPGVGVVGVDLVEVGDRVEAPGHVAHRLAGGDAEGAQHHGQRGRDLLAEADPVAEEELVDGVGPGRQRRDVRRVVGVRADPVDERLHLVVGRGVAGGDRPGQRQHAGVGVRQLLLLLQRVGREGERAVVGPELRRGRRADLRIDGVDGPAAQSRGATRWCRRRRRRPCRRGTTARSRSRRGRRGSAVGLAT